MTGQAEIFPATAVSWLDARVRHADAAALEEARRHVMTVYFTPLMVYIKGSSFRTLGDADEIVSGFFADRLAKPDYLERWLGSGAPLRAWLMRGMKYYCMELIRANKRSSNAPLIDDTPASDDAPSDDFSRELIRSLVDEAIRRTVHALDAEGMAQHWRAFARHHIDREPYARIATELGVNEERASVMSRTASRRLRVTIREMCAWPGASDADVDREIMSLMH